MLRAALVGLPSSGKTTLFQLMTSIHDAPRGKGDVNIGISKVPDDRLDNLTAMYNPRKRVPATVEFTDIIVAGRTGTGAQALVDVAGYKNADALVHVVRAFRAASTAAGSRSSPINREAPPANSARACPPRPAVQSTNTPPRDGSRCSSTSATITGSCDGLMAHMPCSDSFNPSSSVH